MCAPSDRVGEMGSCCESARSTSSWPTVSTEPVRIIPIGFHRGLVSMPDRRVSSCARIAALPRSKWSTTNSGPFVAAGAAGVCATALPCAQCSGGNSRTLTMAEVIIPASLFYIADLPQERSRGPACGAQRSLYPPGVSARAHWLVLVERCKSQVDPASYAYHPRVRASSGSTLTEKPRCDIVALPRVIVKPLRSDGSSL